jgi:PTS system nitrogen regulatory IIA component
MNLISKLLRPSHVVLGLNVSSKKELFEYLGTLFESHQQLTQKVVVDSLTSRERLGSTAMGYGLAIPHWRVKHLQETLCAFVRTAQPIPFDAPDGLPVDLTFTLLVPEHANEHHLQILGELAHLFGDAATREQLRSISDPVLIHKLLTEWSPNAPSKRSAAL